MISVLALLAKVANGAVMVAFIWAMTHGALRRGQRLVVLAVVLAAAATILSAWNGSGLTVYISAATFVFNGVTWLVITSRLRAEREIEQARQTAAVEASLHPSDRKWLTRHRQLADGEGCRD